MARPVIAKKTGRNYPRKKALQQSATALPVRATTRFVLNWQSRLWLLISTSSLLGEMKKWTLDSREAEIEYCKQHGIHLPFSADTSYSRDRNLWHISHEGLELEDPANEPNYKHLLVLGNSPEEAPEEGEYVTMTFEHGVPKSVNGKEMKVSDIIRELNRLGGKHGIGIVDIVENRVVGMKSRGVYETPGGTILYEAYISS